MAAINEKYLENIVHSRLADYRRKDPAQERAELVELWRKSHPEAAHEARGLVQLAAFAQKILSDEPAGVIGA